MMPQRIKIGHLTISVERTQDATDWDGLANYAESRIYLRDGLALDREQQVLIHECFHFLLDNAGIKQTNKTHQEVDVLASGFLALLRDNSDVMKYLMRKRNGRKSNAKREQ
jgi:Zn-dependent peptidase ImmA (M78 family)